MQEIWCEELLILRVPRSSCMFTGCAAEVVWVSCSFPSASWWVGLCTRECSVICVVLCLAVSVCCSGFVVVVVGIYAIACERSCGCKWIRVLLLRRGTQQLVCV